MKKSEIRLKSENFHPCIEINHNFLGEYIQGFQLGKFEKQRRDPCIQIDVFREFTWFLFYLRRFSEHDLESFGAKPRTVKNCRKNLHQDDIESD